MTRNAVIAATLSAALLLLGALSSTVPAQAASPPMRFGMDLGSIDAQGADGIAPDYGTFWVGPWTLKHGWGGPDAEFARAYAADVTPVVHLYYWGDDISPACVRDGCWSDLHDAHKDQAGWDRLTRELAEHLTTQMKGREAIVLLESEFNKGGIEAYEDFDRLLAEKADALHAGYPAARVVLAFGNWGSDAWGRFDRAAAACDLVGLQGMRGSTRDTLPTYLELATSTVQGAQKLQALFHKPVLVTDIALSSHPEPDYLEHQRAALLDLFARLPDLKGAGVVGLLYRAYQDDPGMDTANYYGEAERHWGTHWSDGRAKPAHDAWADGVRAERAMPSPSTSAAAQTTRGVALQATGSQRVEAEAFEERIAGGRQPDGTASGGHRWNLWENGHIAQRIEVSAAGTWDIRVRASGQSLGGVAPHMEIRVDGVLIHAADPGPGAWQTYAEPMGWLESGPHTVQIRFTNDAMAGREDRNLLVDYADFEFVPPTTPTPTPDAGPSSPPPTPTGSSPSPSTPPGRPSLKQVGQWLDALGQWMADLLPG